SEVPERGEEGRPQRQHGDGPVVAGRQVPRVDREQEKADDLPQQAAEPADRRVADEIEEFLEHRSAGYSARDTTSFGSSRRIANRGPTPVFIPVSVENAQANPASSTSRSVTWSNVWALPNGEANGRSARALNRWGRKRAQVGI